MKKLVEEAVRVLRELPEEQQEVVARAIIKYGAGAYTEAVEDLDLSSQE